MMATISPAFRRFAQGGNPRPCATPAYLGPPEGELIGVIADRILLRLAVARRDATEMAFAADPSEMHWENLQRAVQAVHKVQGLA